MELPDNPLAGLPLDPETNLPEKFSYSQSFLKTRQRARMLPFTGTYTGRDLSKYTPFTGEDINTLRDLDLEEMRAQGQGWELIPKVIAQSIGEIVGGVIEDVGYILDIPDVVNNLWHGADAEWGNALSEFGRQVKEYVRNDLAPIYQTREAQRGFALLDPTWWASNAPSIASMLALLIPVGLVARGVTRGTALLAALGGRPLGRGAQKATEVIIGGLLSRHAEGMMEGAETFERAIREGLSPEEAGEIAFSTYRNGYWLLALDMLQYGALLKAGSIANRNAKKAFEVASGRAVLGEAITEADLAEAGIKRLDWAKQMLSEGGEELFQDAIQRESDFKIDLLTGKATEDRGLIARLGEMVLDRKAWDSFIFGALGGGVFHAAGSIAQRRVEGPRQEREKRQLEDLTRRANVVRGLLETASGFQALGRTDLVEEVIDAGTMELGLRAAMKGNIGMEREMLRSISQLSEEELAERGFSPEAKERAERGLRVLSIIESAYNRYANLDYNLEENERDQLPSLLYELTRTEAGLHKLREKRNQLGEELSRLESERETNPLAEEEIGKVEKELEKVASAIASEKKRLDGLVKSKEKRTAFFKARVREEEAREQARTQQAEARAAEEREASVKSPAKGRLEDEMREVEEEVNIEDIFGTEPEIPLDVPADSAISPDTSVEDFMPQDIAPSEAPAEQIAEESPVAETKATEAPRNPFASRFESSPEDQDAVEEESASEVIEAAPAAAEAPTNPFASKFADSSEDVVGETDSAEPTPREKEPRSQTQVVYEAMGEPDTTDEGAEESTPSIPAERGAGYTLQKLPVHRNDPEWQRLIAYFEKQTDLSGHEIHFDFDPNDAAKYDNLTTDQYNALVRGQRIVRDGDRYVFEGTTLEIDPGSLSIRAWFSKNGREIKGLRSWMHKIGKWAEKGHTKTEVQDYRDLRAQIYNALQEGRAVSAPVSIPSGHQDEGKRRSTAGRTRVALNDVKTPFRLAVVRNGEQGLGYYFSSDEVWQGAVPSEDHRGQVHAILPMPGGRETTWKLNTRPVSAEEAALVWYLYREMMDKRSDDIRLGDMAPETRERIEAKLGRFSNVRVRDLANLIVNEGESTRSEKEYKKGRTLHLRAKSRTVFVGPYEMKVKGDGSVLVKEGKNQRTITEVEAAKLFIRTLRKHKRPQVHLKGIAQDSILDLFPGETKVTLFGKNYTSYQDYLSDRDVVAFDADPEYAKEGRLFENPTIIYDTPSFQEAIESAVEKPSIPEASDDVDLPDIVREIVDRAAYVRGSRMMLRRQIESSPNSFELHLKEFRIRIAQAVEIIFGREESNAAVLVSDLDYAYKTLNRFVERFESGDNKLFSDKLQLKRTEEEKHRLVDEAKSYLASKDQVIQFFRDLVNQTTTSGPKAESIDQYFRLVPETSKPQKERTFEEEVAWLQEKLPNVPLNIIEDLVRVKENTGSAYGMFSRGMITLSELAAEGTAYHEAFHAVFHLYLSPEEREQILQEAARRYNVSRKPLSEEGLNRLKDALTRLGFSQEELAELEAEGIAAGATVDLITKTLRYQQGQEDTLPREAAYVMWKLVSKDSQLRRMIHTYLPLWSGYKASLSRHQKEGADEALVRHNVALDLLESVLREELSEKESQESTIKRLLTKIKEILDRWLKVSESVARDLAKDFLGAQEKYFNKTRRADTLAASMGEALSADPRASEIVSGLRGIGALLTGSLALREQGTVYRSGEESLHDLDFTVARDAFSEDADLLAFMEKGEEIFDSRNKNRIKLYLDELSKRVEDSSFVKKVQEAFPTYRILKQFHGYKQEATVVLGVIDGEFDAKGNYIEDTGYKIDFFISPTLTQKEIERDGLQKWEYIFRAKLQMGRQKDLQDFFNFEPRTKGEPSKEGLRHISLQKTKETDLQIEERLAEDFREYVQARREGRTLSFANKVADFFQRLWNLIQNVFGRPMTRERLFRNIEAGVYRKAPKKGYDGVRYKLADLSWEARQHATGFMVYMMMTKSGVRGAEDVTKLSFLDPVFNGKNGREKHWAWEGVLRGLEMKGGAEAATAALIREHAGTPDNPGELIREVRIFLRGLGIQQKGDSFENEDRGEYGEEVDPEFETENDDEGTLARQISNPFEFSNKATAAQNILLLIATIPEVRYKEDGSYEIVKSEVLPGLPVLADYSKLWKKLEESLSDLVDGYENGVRKTAYEKMMERLKVMRRTDARIGKLLDALFDKNYPEYKRTQFFVAFNKVNQRFRDFLWARQEGQFLFTISGADTQSTQRRLIDEWATAFHTPKEGIHRFMWVDENEIPHINTATVDKAVEWWEEFRDRLDNPTERDVKNLLAFLDRLGVEVSPGGWNAYMELLGDSPERQLIKLRSFLNDIVLGGSNSQKQSAMSLYRMSSRAKNPLKAEEVLNKPIVSDWSIFEELAYAEALSRGEGSENTVFGPGAKPYYNYSLPNGLQEQILRLSDPNDSIVEDLLAMPFYERSRVLQHLRNPANRRRLKVGTYLNFKELYGGDQGNKFPDLKLGDETVMRLVMAMMGQYSTLNLADKSNFYPIEGLPTLENAYEVHQSHTPGVGDLSGFVNHSGGAVGSDTAWDEIGREYGMVQNKHYYYGKKTPNGNTPITDAEYREGVEKVRLANRALRRQPDKYMSLLARNWQQVKNADAVFAVGRLASQTQVDGGTGWAVQMAIDAGKPVYVFDQSRGRWYAYRQQTDLLGNSTGGVFVETETPILTKNFAGIGTRDLNDAGREAIRQVYEKTKNGETIRDVRIGATTIKTFSDYFLSEYVRMGQAHQQAKTLPKEKQVQYYHSGNAFKSTVFPELSPENLRTSDPATYALLYDSEGVPLLWNDVTSEQEDALYAAIEPVIRQALIDRVQEQLDDLVEKALLKKTESGYETTDNTWIPNEVLGTKLPEAVIGSAVINQTMAHFELMSILHGDYAAYESVADLDKRTPEIGGFGLKLRTDPESGVSPTFRVAVMKDVVRKSEYNGFEEIRETSGDKKSKIVDYKGGPGFDAFVHILHKRDGGTLFDAKKKAARLLKSYNKVNVVDGQGYMTLARFREVMIGFGRWTPRHEELYPHVQRGEWPREIQELYDEYLAIQHYKKQPLKPVHFEVTNYENAPIPVFLKYSTAVLFPALTKGTPLDKLRVQLEAQNIQEAVFESGVKVGARGITEVFDENGLVKDNIQFTPITLSNSKWRLQVDLPSKGAHDTLEGSQARKLIYVNMLMDGDYKLDGKLVKGRDLLKMIHDVHSAISDLGWESLKEEWGIDSEGRITNIEGLAKTLREEFEGKEATDNLLDSLKVEGGAFVTPLDASTARSQIQNMMFSILRNRTVRTKTFGGSFIQLSSQGLTQPRGWSKLSDEEKAATNKWGPLTPPQYDPETDTWKPGGVLLPAYMGREVEKAAGKRLHEMTKEEIMKWIDPEVLRIVTYRIPTQGRGSIDVAQVEGFLPPEAGDTIVMFDEVTAKTGSDFDIDKMYVMLPNTRFFPEYQRDEEGKYVRDEEGNRVISGGKVKQIPYLDESNSTSEERYDVWIKASLTKEERSRLKKLRENYRASLNEIRKGREDAWKQHSAELDELYAGRKAARQETKDIEAKLEKVRNIILQMERSASKLESELKEVERLFWSAEESGDREEEALYGKRAYELGAAIKAQRHEIDRASELHRKLFEEQSGLRKEGDVLYDLEKRQVEVRKEATRDFQKLLDVTRESFQEEQDKIYAAARVRVPLEVFQSWSLDRQNIRRALENRILELYEAVLSHPEGYVESNTPLGVVTGKLKTLSEKIEGWIQEAEEGTKPKRLESLRWLTPLHQMHNKQKFSVGKQLTGSVALHLSHIPVAQGAGLYYNGKLLDGWVINLERPWEDLKKSFQVEEDDDGWVTTLAESHNTEGDLISDVLSGKLDGTVDVAKGAWLYGLGFNSITANVDLLLSRAGARPEFIALFLQQPIIRDYVRKTQIFESDLIEARDEKGKLLSAKELVVREWRKNLESAVKTKESRNPLDLKVMENSIRGLYKDEQFYRDQLAILEHFTGPLMDAGKALFDAVLASKVDTQGAGKNVAEWMVILERFNSVLNDERLGNFSAIFKRGGSLTMHGTYMKNGVFPVEALLSGIFLDISPEFRGVVTRVFEMMGRSKAQDVEIVEKVLRHTFTAALSGTQIAPTKDEMQLFFFGDNTLAHRLKALQDTKKHGPEVTENELIRYLTANFGRGKKSPSFVQGSGKVKGRHHANVLKEAWQQLLESEDAEVRSFAEALVRYAYATSGWMKTIYGFYDLIPQAYLQEIGLGEDVRRMPMLVEENAEEIASQFFRHNWQDTKLVPKVRSRGILAPLNDKGVKFVGGGQRLVFQLDRKKAENYKIGSERRTTIEGEEVTVDIFPRYVSYLHTPSNEELEVNPNAKPTENLYELVGYAKNWNPVYNKVAPLGTVRAGNKVYEYDITAASRGERASSVFNKNVEYRQQVTYPVIAAESPEFFNLDPNDLPDSSEGNDNTNC